LRSYIGLACINRRCPRITADTNFSSRPVHFIPSHPFHPVPFYCIASCRVKSIYVVYRTTLREKIVNIFYMVPRIVVYSITIGPPISFPENWKTGNAITTGAACRTTLRKEIVKIFNSVPGIAWYMKSTYCFPFLPA